MPRYLPSIPFEDCFGSVGDKTYFHRGKDCFYKKKAHTDFPGTDAQLEQASLHRRALDAWRTLSQQTQETWSSFALDAPSKRPPFDRNAHISGYNLFVSAYHGFAQLGREHVPDPARYTPFPDYFLDWTGLRILDGTDLQLDFFCSIGDGSCGHRYRLLLKLELTRPGRGRQPGLQRNFLAMADCTDADGPVSFLIPDYREVWKLDLPEYTAHCRFILIDTQTGYRSRFRMQTSGFSLG